MNKTLVLVLFVLLCATFANAENYDKSNAEKELKDKCGKNWNIRWNNETNTPHYIYGSKCNVAKNKESNIKDKDKIKNIFESSIKELRNFFDINEKDLRFKRIEEGNNDWYVEYQQYYQNLPVESATVSMTISNNGDLLTAESNFQKNITVNSTPSLKAEKAIEIAENHANFNFIDRTIKTNITKEMNYTLAVLPINNSYELIWKITLYSSPSPLIHKEIFVNSQNGKIVKEINLVLDNFNIYGNINGYIYPHHYYDTPQLVTLNNLAGYVNILDYDPPYPSYFVGYASILGGNSYNSGWITDDCKYSFDSDSQTCADPFAGTYLSGNYVGVINDLEGTYYKGSSGYFLNLAGSGQADVIFQAGDETNCYYYANDIHSIFKGSPYNFNGMDYPVQCHTSANVANGQADGTNIYFASYAKTGMYFARSSDTIYHEYTHNVIYHLYGGFIGYGGYMWTYSSEGAAMDEGIPDYFAAAINNDPIIGEEFVVGNLNYVNRNLDTGYPHFLTDPASYVNYDYSNTQGIQYKNSMIISGTLWDIRKVMGAPASWLVFNTLRSNPRTFQQMYDYMLVKDDNNANVRDGTPNGATIFSSFKQHGMDFNYGPFAYVAGVSTTPTPSNTVYLTCIGGDTDCKATKKYYFDSDGVCSGNLNDYIYSTTDSSITINTPHNDYICLRVEDYLGDTATTVSAKLNIASVTCSTNSQCGTNGYVGTPSCSGKNINQNYVTYTCNNPGTTSSYCSNSQVSQQKQICTDSCSGGICVGIVCNVDADCGNNGFTGALSCNGNNVTQNYKIYKCNNPGTSSASCSNSQVLQPKQTCTDSCSAGICVTPACKSDSDCGKDGYVGTPSCSGNNVQDTWRTYKCNNPGTLSASCSNSDKTQLKQTCSDVCEVGSCVCHPVYTCGEWSPSICPMVINGIYFGEQSKTCTDTKCGTGSISEKRKC